MRKKALLVESSKLFQEMISQLLAQIGIDCHTCTSGREALEAGRDNYNFILVSRTLRDIDGESFLKRYAIEPGVGKATTIFMVSENSEQISASARKAGFCHSFNKKDINQFQELMTKLLNAQTIPPGVSILLVEDSIDVAKAVQHQFTEYGANMTWAMGIKEAEEAIQSQDYDLVITDYYLKGHETGDDVISLIRRDSDQHKACTPILMVSGETNNTRRTAFLRNGANDFIIKPYDCDELLIRSSNLIKNHRLLYQSIKQQKLLAKLALTDHLTGTYNRHSLYEMGNKYLENARKNNHDLALLVIDLDHFKSINDTYGHTVGDKVLRSIARALKAACRTEDFVARFGGEEFVMLLPDCNLHHGIIKAETLRKAIEQVRPANIKVTGSIGISAFSGQGDFNQLFEKADKALYQAKQKGRNCISPQLASVQ